MIDALAVDTVAILERLVVDQELDVTIRFDLNSPQSVAWHVRTSEGSGALGEDLLDALQEVNRQIFISHESGHVARRSAA